MVLYPRYVFELYKKIGEDVFSPTPISIPIFSSIDMRFGVDKVKDVANVHFSNVSNLDGTFKYYLGKSLVTNNLFAIDDEIKIYAYYDTAPSDLDDALLIAGRITGFNYIPTTNDLKFTVKIVNRSEELLNTLVPFSSRANLAPITSPNAIKQLVNRANRFNKAKPLFAYLTTETNPITGQPGYIQAVKSDGSAFEAVDYNETWKPLYDIFEKLSSPEYTGDTLGNYIFYIRYSKVLPQFQDVFGTTINELVWKSKSLNTENTLTESVDLRNIRVELSTKEIQNLLIVNAGTDKNGNGITGVAYNLESMGKYGAKFGYYTKSRRVYSSIATEEQRILEGNGVVFGSDGFPETAEFPIIMSFSGRDVYNVPDGSTLTATNKKEWNQYLRDEARALATLEAEEVLQKLGDPLFKVSADALIGSNDLVLGGINNIVIPSYGWDTGMKLRLKEVSHSLETDGWQTKYVFEEDEKVISDRLNE